MADCKMSRFFNMLKKLEILAKFGEQRRRRCLCISLAKEYPSCRRFRAAQGAVAKRHWSTAMLWTEEAVEDLKKLALAGKSASHIAAELGVGSRNAVIGKASRIGIKLNGRRRRVAASGAAPARAAPPHMGGLASCAEPGPSMSASPVAPSRRGGAGRRRHLAEPRSARCGGYGSRTSANPAAGGRSATREAATSPIAGLRRPEVESYCAGHCRVAYRAPQARGVARERQGFRAIAGS